MAMNSRSFRLVGTSIAHYEDQTEDEQFAEIEAALEAESVTRVAIPNELMPDVRALIARKRSA